jgi:DNA-binding Xre family transcriptional regulator
MKLNNKFSTIKERILYLLEMKGITKEKFFIEIGMTYGNFTGKAKKTPLNSRAIGNIFSKIPDVNLEWLIIGSGIMFKKNEVIEEKNEEPSKKNGKFETENEILNMKEVKEKSIHYVVENLVKIMNDRKLTKIAFAELIGFDEPKWNKISNGIQSLRVGELSKIAEKLQMRDVDIITYPKVYSEIGNVHEGVKAQVTVELKEELKTKVLNLVFGNKNLEILNNLK